MTAQRVSIIIPAYNEAESLGEVLDRLHALEAARDWEIVVVDDCSQDNTSEVAREKGAVVVRHPQNLGNGASIRSGAAKATGDILVMMDADGQHPPEDVEKLLVHVGEYDMVVGARTKSSNVSAFRSVGNVVLTAAAKYLSGREIMDLTSGFRAVKREYFEEFEHLFPQRYSYPTTITMAMLSGGYFVKYVPLDSICKRETGTSGIRPFRDGFRFLNIMLRIVILFNPMKMFVPLSLTSFVVGLAIGLYGIIRFDNLQESAVLTLILGVFLFFFGVLADQISHVRRDIRHLSDRSKEREDGPKA